MNARRIAAILREIAALQVELADAYEQAEPKRARRVKVQPPEAPVSDAARDAARRAARKAGVAA